MATFPTRLHRAPTCLDVLYPVGKLVYTRSLPRLVVRFLPGETNGPAAPTTVPAHASITGRLMIFNTGRQSTRAFGSQAPSTWAACPKGPGEHLGFGG
jgi:hypothetical protein